MRWYNIVTGILLTLPIVDFALAAPVLVQEKSQARVGGVHIPKDVITGLWKRWDEEIENPENLENLERMIENYFKTMTSSPSSSALSVPGHGPTNVELLPTQNLASSAANMDPLIEMWSSSSTDVVRPPPPPPNQESSTANREPLVVASNAPGADDESRGPLYTPTSSSSGYSSDYSSDYGLSEAEKHMYAPQPSYYPIASSPGDDVLSVVNMQNSGWDRFNAPGDDRLSQEGDGELRGPLYTPTSSESGYGSELELAEEHMYAPRPDHYSIASTDTSIGSNFDWDDWMNSKDTAPPSPASPEDQVHSPSLGVWSPTEPEHEAVPAPPPSHLPDPPSTSG